MIFAKKLQPQMDLVIDQNKAQVLVLPLIRDVKMLHPYLTLMYYANHGAHNVSLMELDV